MDSSFISIESAAVRLGVPAAWLKREAREGRVPALRAGRRLLVKPQDVEAALAAQARVEKEVPREE